MVSAYSFTHVSRMRTGMVYCPGKALQDKDLRTVPTAKQRSGGTED